MDFVSSNLKKHSLLWIFLFTAGLVFFIQFTILQPVIQYRLFNRTEDWPFLVLYYSYSDPLTRFKDIWTGSGLHTTSEIYYTGLVASIAGYNYQEFHIINVILKAVSVLSLFPLVFVVFRHKLLAWLATVLYAFNAATSGSFLWIGKGSVYVATISLNIFLVSYYYAVIKQTKGLLILSTFLFVLTYFLSPSRLFPLLILILLIEIFWLISTGIKKNFRFSIIRLVFYFLPVILISKSAPISSCCPFTKQPFLLLNDILNGNWNDILYPFAATGYILFPSDYWKFLGDLNYQTFQEFGEYITFIFGWPFLTFGTFTLIMSHILSKKPGKFFLQVFSLNVVLEILMFFLAGHHFAISKQLLEPYNPVQFVITKYPTLIALYIFSITFVSFWEWKNQKTKNKLLMAVWIGPIFASIFIWPTWMLIKRGLLPLYSSVNWYLIIPSLGTALFLAAILTLLYEKMKESSFGRYFAVFIIFVVLGIYYFTNSQEIKRTFMALNPEQVKIHDQQMLHDKLMGKLRNYAYGNLLIFLDIDDVPDPRYYLEALVMTDDVFGKDDIGDWIQYRRKSSATGCIQAIADKDILKKSFYLKDGQSGFVYKGVCIDYKDSPVYSKKDNVSYNLEDFVAFKIKDSEFIDIREQVLKELNP